MGPVSQALRRPAPVVCLALALSLAACVPTYSVASNDAGLPSSADAALPTHDGAAPDAGVADARSDAASVNDASNGGDGGGDAGPTGLTLDPGFPVTADIDMTTGPSVTTPAFATGGPNRLLVAVFVWGTGGTDEWPLTVTGAGLTWTDATLSSFPDGSVPPGTSGDSVFTAWAATPVSGATVTATRSANAPAVLTIALYSFAGASRSLGAVAQYGNQTTNSQLISTIDTTTAGSIVVGGFHGGTANTFAQPLSNTVWDVTDNYADAPYGHFNAVGRLVGTVTTPGSLTLGSAYSGPYIVTTSVEVLPAP